MNKFLYASSFVLTVFLVAGSYLFPDNLIMWFAAVTQGYNLARIGLALVLLVLIFTLPPRSLYVRFLLGSVSLALVAWTLSALSKNNLKLLDFVLYLDLSVVFCLAALELNPEDEPVVLNQHVVAHR